MYDYEYSAYELEYEYDYLDETYTYSYDLDDDHPRDIQQNWQEIAYMHFAWVWASWCSDIVLRGMMV